MSPINEYKEIKASTLDLIFCKTVDVAMWHYIRGAPQLTKFIINPQIDQILFPLTWRNLFDAELWYMFIPNYNFDILRNISNNWQGHISSASSITTAGSNIAPNHLYHHITHY